MLPGGSSISTAKDCEKDVDSEDDDDNEEDEGNDDDNEDVMSLEERPLDLETTDVLELLARSELETCIFGDDSRS